VLFGSWLARLVTAHNWSLGTWLSTSAIAPGPDSIGWGSGARGLGRPQNSLGFQSKRKECWQVLSKE
jgi:hypothetical protein